MVLRGQGARDATVGTAVAGQREGARWGGVHWGGEGLRNAKLRAQAGGAPSPAPLSPQGACWLPGQRGHLAMLVSAAASLATIPLFQGPTEGSTGWCQPRRDSHAPQAGSPDAGEAVAQPLQLQQAASPPQAPLRARLHRASWTYQPQP
ncbi:hypothetical protein HaLaN_01190 [Haematococcus lacustris]|uniref:Uncharacterized protein n=1 Tax=Haematococcus lacustris TaxID=44745 RepID=A0A699YU43_HAELA|nr:hypothetical protein HaLaN_01190 [Haematococcus lacustris]